MAIIEPHYINLIYRYLIRKSSIFILLFKIKWWGIKIQKPYKAYGKVYFRRKPNSFISFGKSCSFNSSFNSNLIGVNRPCMFSTLIYGSKIEVGDNCGFSGTVLGAFKSITIGSNVLCGANTLITDGDWHIKDSRAGEPAAVIIGDNVWLGEGVKVLKGVCIGENSVIGAGSVVTKSIPANVIAGGNPCKIIKDIKV